MTISMMNAMVTKMNDDKDLSPELRAVLKSVGDDNVSITDADYAQWKEWYETLPEHEKLFRLLGALSQYFTNPCKASSSILMSAIICTSRWCNDKDMEDF